MPMSPAMHQLVNNCNTLIAEAETIAKATPLWWVVADRSIGYTPVVERDGGYALLGGPVAVFPSQFRAERVAVRMEALAPECLRDRIDLGVVQANTWAAIRREELHRMLESVRHACAD